MNESKDEVNTSISADDSDLLWNSENNASMTNNIVKQFQNQLLINASKESNINSPCIVKQREQLERDSKLCSDKVRSDYESIFNVQDTLQKHKPFWFKEQFLSVADRLTLSFIGTLPHKTSRLSKSNFITLRLYSQTLKSEKFKRFSLQDTKVICVGTKIGCDIGFTGGGYDGLSRLHALIFVLYEYDLLLCVDIGSITGITTISRSDTTKEIQNSTQSQCLSFGIGERACLGLGQFQLTLTDDSCPVCTTGRQDVQFEECDHFSCCSNCFKVTKLCPTCNVEFKSSKPIKLESEQNNNYSNLNLFNATSEDFIPLTQCTY